jgi:vesicle coat complex subunit
MKQPEYVEGPKATENFEEGMKALFNVPKDAVVKAEKRRKKSNASRPKVYGNVVFSARNKRGMS